MVHYGATKRKNNATAGARLRQVSEGVQVRIEFPDASSPEAVLGEIREQLGGRRLAKILEFTLEPERLQVMVRKMGTSTLEFRRVRESGGIIWVLETEKLALAHRPMRADLITRLSTVIENSGGRVRLDSV